MALLAKSGVGRDINRHYYSDTEIDEALARPVVQKLCELIRLRNDHPAFQGTFTFEDSTDNALCLKWRNESDFAHLHIDFTLDQYSLTVSEQGDTRSLRLVD